MFDFIESDEFEVRDINDEEMYTLPTMKGYELDEFKMDEIKF